MLAQTVLAALLVAVCTGYAVWTLLPHAARSSIARTLLRLHWPEPLAARLQRHAEAGTGCGCDGCDRATKPAGRRPTEHRIQLHRRPRP